MDEELLERFGGDASLLRELAELFIQSCPKMLEDIRDAVQKRDAKALERAAHSLKGCVGIFFSQGARETAQQLESLGRSGELAGAEELARLLEKQVGEFNRVLAKNIEAMRSTAVSVRGRGWLMSGWPEAYRSNDCDCRVNSADSELPITPR
jgi:HPt (histidine-containing phosphotransfer) domain-containing protein